MMAAATSGSIYRRDRDGLVSQLVSLPERPPSQEKWRWMELRCHALCRSHPLGGWPSMMSFFSLSTRTNCPIATETAPPR